MNKRGIEPIGFVVGLVLALILIFGGWYILQNGISGFFGGIEDCDYHCTDVCGAGSGISSTQVGGEPTQWCRAGIYDLSQDSKEGGTLAEMFSGFKKLTNGDPSRVSGNDLGLQCCMISPISSKEKPEKFLGAELRIDEQDPDRRNDVMYPPHIRTYFGESSSPIRNGETIEVITNKEYTIEFQVERVKRGSGNVEFILEEPETKLHCTAKILNEDKDNIDEELTEVDFSSICKFTSTLPEGTDETAAVAFKQELEFSIPDRYEEENLRIEVTISENEGQYRQRSVDAQFIVNLQVRNPIKFSGLSDTYVREKVLGVSCIDVVCKDFKYVLVKVDPNSEQIQAVSCKKEMFENNAGNDADMSRGENQGSISIGLEGDHYVCVRGRTESGKEYYNVGPIPVRIDKTAPSFYTVFNPGLNMYTRISCQDSKSGCTGAIGYHYINHPVDFIYALIPATLGTGGSGVVGSNYCPSDRKLYTFQPAQPIPKEEKLIALNGDETGIVVPYYGADTVRVLCSRVEDNAGNYNLGVILNYNVWDVVQAIANDQKSNGGFGTGYTGYLHHN